jgi:electron-transferring-flavoprotein dehydrogenase
MTADRQRMDVDIVCVGFGPAVGGFLSTLSRLSVSEDGIPRFESAAAPGLPLQVLCFERADDIGFGVSGVVTRARALRSSFPGVEEAGIPMLAPVRAEDVVYLLDPIGASRRSGTLNLIDRGLRAFPRALGVGHDAVRLPYVPPFLEKHGGLLLSIGQFMQWVGSSVMSTGTAQIWPGSPVDAAIVEDGRVVGVRLLDQGTDKDGNPEAAYLPGMEVRAALTVVGDGPVGVVGRQLDSLFGLPHGNHRNEWALGMKAVVELGEDSGLQPGTVIHTLGYPEPEIFGFLYVHPDRLASMGIFVPSWFDCPVRTAYRYLQHWMLHPYLWRFLQGGRLRSWGAKSLQESGRRGEPHLVGEGYARIGEGSGSTNVLTGSGVDEAWATGVQLAEAVVELLARREPFNRQNLEASYVRRRREGWVDVEGRVAEKARDGFQRGFVRGLAGMALTGMTGGRLWMPGRNLPPHERLPSLEQYYRGRIPAEEIESLRRASAETGASLHESLMDRCGWPAIPHDGSLLVTHQDALLVGGKVQAPPGYADHVFFLDKALCRQCATKLCVAACSGQAISVAGEVPAFDREKCVHCGACLWNCARSVESGSTNIGLRAGAGGLHSGEN